MNVELIEQPWVRSLFEGFCASERLRREKGNIAARVDRYATVFRQIDRSIASQDALTQEALFKVFGAEGLRRVFNVIGYLCEQAGVRWSAQELEMLTERKRWRSTLATCEDRPWYGDIVRYCTVLTAEDEKKRSERTIRLYLTAAIGLLRHARVGDVRDLNQQHLEAYLCGTPGQAASLYSFVTHLNAVFGLGLLGRQHQRTPPRAVERKLRTELVGILTALEQADNPLRRRALLLDAISRLYQLPLKMLLGLRQEQVIVSGDQVTLAFPAFEVALDQDLGRMLLGVVEPGHSSLVFPGRNGNQPLTVSALRYHTGLSN